MRRRSPDSRDPVLKVYTRWMPRRIEHRHRSTGVKMTIPVDMTPLAHATQQGSIYDVDTRDNGGAAMRTTAQKWGNSLAIRVPKSVADEAGLKVKDDLDIEVRKGALILKPPRGPREADHLTQSPQRTDFGERWDERRCNAATVICAGAWRHRLAAIQFSSWPPAGWSPAGWRRSGDRTACLMRPPLEVNCDRARTIRLSNSTRLRVVRHNPFRIFRICGMVLP